MGLSANGRRLKNPRKSRVLGRRFFQKVQTRQRKGDNPLPPEGTEELILRCTLNRPAPLFAVLLVVLCCSSCQEGKKFYPVRGQVLVDGKPAERALVVFHPVDDADPQKIQPSAAVEADGSFNLKSYIAEDRVTRDGAPAGAYRVTVQWFPLDRSN